MTLPPRPKQFLSTYPPTHSVRDVVRPMKCNYRLIVVIRSVQCLRTIYSNNNRQVKPDMHTTGLDTGVTVVGNRKLFLFQQQRTVFVASMGRHENVAHDILSRRIIIQAFVQNVSIFFFQFTTFPRHLLAITYTAKRATAIFMNTRRFDRKMFSITRAARRRIKQFEVSHIFFYVFHNYFKLVIETVEISNFLKVSVIYIVPLTDTFHRFFFLTLFYTHISGVQN